MDTDAESENPNFFHEQYNSMISEMAIMIQEQVAKEKFAIERRNASLIQETLNNHSSTKASNLVVHGQILSADECSGDWWYSYTKNDFLYVWVGDVTGHGVSAAIVASACRALVMEYEITNTPISLADQASSLNKVIFKMFEQSALATFCALKICQKTLACEVINGSHPDIFIKSPQSTDLQNLKPSSPLGARADSKYHTNHLQLKCPFQIFITTDGFFELSTLPNKRWSQVSIKKFIERISRQDSAQEIIQTLKKKIEKVRDPSKGYEDDITMVIIDGRTAQEKTQGTSSAA